jgi:hypothetical protein
MTIKWPSALQGLKPASKGCVHVAAEAATHKEF